MSDADKNYFAQLKVGFFLTSLTLIPIGYTTNGFLFFNFKSKKVNQKLILVSIMAAMCVLGTTCSNTENTQQQQQEEEVNNNEAVYDLPELEGKYTLPSDGCDLVLTIKKEKNGLEYAFVGMGGIIDMSGKILFSKEEDSYRLTFDGPIENNPPKSVEAIFKDKSITIQNYGNAEQNFTIFSDCEEKYLEFKKK